MITDDKRRDVAEILRKTPVERYNSILNGLHLGESVGVGAQIVSPHEDQVRAAADHIADLIEPELEITARLEYDEFHGCNICTGCGERYEHGMYMAVTYDDFIAYKPMRYCPACGARLEGVGR